MHYSLLCIKHNICNSTNVRARARVRTHKQSDTKSWRNRVHKHIHSQCMSNGITVRNFFRTETNHDIIISQILRGKIPNKTECQMYFLFVFEEIERIFASWKSQKKTNRKSVTIVRTNKIKSRMRIELFAKFCCGCSRTTDEQIYTNETKCRRS